MPQSSPDPNSSLSPTRCSLGLVSYCFNIAQREKSAANSPLEFLKNARSMGAAGAQLALGTLSNDEANAVREYVEKEGLFIEGTLALPNVTSADFDRFVVELQRSKQCGARIVRTVMLPGRRYEQFSTFREYQRAMRAGVESLQRAEPIARHEGVRLAVENHKDQRTGERLAILQGISSEFIGACLDVGNNLALLEDPLATAKAFAPWVLSVHFKDQGLAPSEHGFLLADVPVGEGVIDLKSILGLLRTEAPRSKLFLELITRDPLSIPILTDQYWETLDEIPAREMAAVLAMIQHAGKKKFPIPSQMLPEQQLALERENIKKSLAAAVSKLGLKV